MPLSVDNNKCIGCKLCYELCPQDVFEWDEKAKKPLIGHQFECSHCGICWVECPKRAIDLTLPAQFY
jgi:NAD-dependent dihydropyrimidine dehydrogenase PreA subunit